MDKKEKQLLIDLIPVLIKYDIKVIEDTLNKNRQYIEDLVKVINKSMENSVNMDKKTESSKNNKEKSKTLLLINSLSAQEKNKKATLRGIYSKISRKNILNSKELLINFISNYMTINEKENLEEIIHNFIAFLVEKPEEDLNSIRLRVESELGNDKKINKENNLLNWSKIIVTERKD